jgi:hypothetical protein
VKNENSIEFEVLVSFGLQCHVVETQPNILEKYILHEQGGCLLVKDIMDTVISSLKEYGRPPW